MSVEPMRVQGAFIPFTKPVPLPGPLADDEPVMSICFNASWLPAVLGALKSLARPETWQGTPEDIRSSCASVHDLLSSYEDFCISDPPHLNWYPLLTVVQGAYEEYVWASPDFGYYVPGDPYARYILVIWPDPTDPPIFELTFHDWDTGDAVGGLVQAFRIMNTLDPAGKAFVLTNTDCLDVTTVDSNFTPQDYTFTSKDIQVVCGHDSVYVVEMIMRGSWLCTSA